MADPLTAKQLLVLSQEYAQLATTLTAYQNAHSGDPDVDVVVLQQLISGINSSAGTLANQAVATAFDNVGQTYTNLVTITDHANKAATSLTQEVKKFSRIASIATSMVNLASALGSGNAVAVFTAIASCSKAIQSGS